MQSARLNMAPFSNLNDEARSYLDGLGMQISYIRGNRLFTEGERSTCVFFLSSGRVKLSVTSREGRTLIVRIAEGGQLLGMSAALSGTAHELTAEAMEPCVVKAVPSRDFLLFLKTYPEAAMEATRCVLGEYQSALNDVCRLALPSTVAGRLANLLLEWQKGGLAGGQDSRRFTMTLTHEEIAGMAATSRETVTRVFNQFEREKLISIKGASMTVLQPEALEQLAM
ncbi:MAG TPA: Crp/Fnr family transcriptional regulator [Candidatus Angelobacter sp.]|nr:Crp/Fnr family transcriptional regulator [Candidatus Angelobacter sp.]